ncbi:MAG TPA: hypothetical protein VI197_25940 [Polyangiaceae bacterium]
MRAGSVIYQAWSDYYLAQALPASEVVRRQSLMESAKRTAQSYALGRLQSMLST